MLHICGSYDEDVFTKFQKDEQGKFTTSGWKRRLISVKRTPNQGETIVRKKKMSITHLYHMLNIWKMKMKMKI